MSAHLKTLTIIVHSFITDRQHLCLISRYIVFVVITLLLSLTWNPPNFVTCERCQRTLQQSFIDNCYPDVQQQQSPLWQYVGNAAFAYECTL